MNILLRSKHISKIVLLAWLCIIPLMAIVQPVRQAAIRPTVEVVEHPAWENRTFFVNGDLVEWAI